MADIIYNRPVGRPQYICIAKHQLHARNAHSKWLGVPIEKETFDAADYGNHNQTPGNFPWQDNNGNYWGFLNNFPFVGTEKQQFGFFINPNNPNLAWHGYPATPFSKKRLYVSQELIQRWVDEGFLDYDDINDIINQKRVK